MPRDKLCVSSRNAGKTASSLNHACTTSNAEANSHHISPYRISGKRANRVLLLIHATLASLTHAYPATLLVSSPESFESYQAMSCPITTLKYSLRIRAACRDAARLKHASWSIVVVTLWWD